MLRAPFISQPGARDETYYEISGPERVRVVSEWRSQTFNSRCSRSQELMTCANVSYSASLTAV